MDTAGEAYVAGATDASDFPIANPLQPINTDQYGSAFVSKVSADGSSLIYSTYLGGTTEEKANAIAVDATGSAYVAGFTFSGDFPTVNPIQNDPAQNDVSAHVNAFVSKLNPEGSALTCSTALGGSYYDEGTAVAVDAEGDIYVTGSAQSTDFPVYHAYQSTLKSDLGAFITKISLASNPAVDTSTTLIVNANPQVQGQPVRLTIKVAAVSGSFVPSGQVALVINGGAPQSIALDSTGSTTYVTSSLRPGTYTAQASYPGVVSGVPGGNLGPSTSNTSTETVIDTLAATPTISPAAETYASAQSVTISDSTSGATIYYTTDGSAPSTTSTKYTTAVNISSSKTLKAIAAASGYSNSEIASATYTITSVTKGAGLQFIPVTPCRVADTRNAAGPFGGPSLTAAATREFDIPQSGCGIPSTAVAYSLNVTVVPAATLDYLTLWPTGQTQPNVSTLNSLDGRTKANAAITPGGTNGGVDVYVSDATNVILDVDGYFVPAGTTGTATTPLAFYPLTPCRIADTRNAAGPLGGPYLAATTSRSFPVQSSSCGIPATAQAYSLNVTAIPHTKLDYLTTWPTGETQPNVSTLNATTGTITTNAAIVPAGSSASTGAVSIYVSDAADVILDVNGYFAPASASGLSLYTTAPCRVIDTRSASGLFNGVLTVPIATSSCAPPTSAQAYVLNATVVPPAALTYLTLWPDGATQPNVSTLNALDGAITSNMAIVPTTNGTIDAFSSNPTQLILDLSSYFAP